MLSTTFSVGEQVKEQYIGDVSDYQKYALLRALTVKTDLRLGICWMLTLPDGRLDGSRLGFLKKPQQWRTLDAPVFDLLDKVAAGALPRQTGAIEGSGILPAAVYVNELLADSPKARETYMAEAKRRLSSLDLVFFDPDNGLEVSSVQRGRKNSSKYLYLDEAAEFWECGASLLIYQHYPFIKKAEFEARVTARLEASLAGAEISLFATAHAVFILVAQTRHTLYFQQATRLIDSTWPSWFASPRRPPYLPPCDVTQKAVTGVTGLSRLTHDDVCEARVPGGAWVQIGIAEAIERRGFVDLRCVECHGRVRAHSAASDESFRAHFEHAQRHAGCSRSPRYSGTQTRHRTAIE